MAYTRRDFFRTALAVGGGSAVVAFLSQCTGNGGGMIVDDISSVESLEPFVTPVGEFFRTDTILGALPEVDAETWSLRIHGMVTAERTLTLAEINAMPQVSNVITLGCVSNPVGGDLIGNARWGGVLLADVLRECGIDQSAEQLVSTSVDGWTCGTPVSAVMDGRPAMLATSMNGEPLTPLHGFPVRMVVPGLFGYVSATKWVTDIEITTWDAYDAYWVEYGWAKEGPFLASSRIDVPRAGARVPAGQAAVGGFAWSPRAGVRAVELRVDEGEWQRMNIVPGATNDTWCQWTGTWQASPGDRTLTVRVTDNDGVVQTETVRPPEPSGATGHHKVKVRVV